RGQIRVGQNDPADAGIRERDPSSRRVNSPDWFGRNQDVRAEVVALTRRDAAKQSDRSSLSSERCEYQEDQVLHDDAPLILIARSTPKLYCPHARYETTIQRLELRSTLVPPNTYFRTVAEPTNTRT